jgi:hypothetical protein
MSTPILGRLEKVHDLRTAWIVESSDFTPWLALPENLKLLGEAVGIDLNGLDSASGFARIWKSFIGSSRPASNNSMQRI